VEVIKYLRDRGANTEATYNVARALCLGKDDTLAPVDTFVKRLRRTQGPVELGVDIDAE